MGVSLRHCRGHPLKGDQVGVDVVGFGDTEVGVEGQGVLPVVAGLVGIAGGLVGVGEAVVGTGLLVAVADLGGQGERCAVMSVGLVVMTSGVVRLAKTEGYSAVCVEMLSRMCRNARRRQLRWSQ